jgi:hypothetical protein
MVYVELLIVKIYIGYTGWSFDLSPREEIKVQQTRMVSSESAKMDKHVSH